MKYLTVRQKVAFLELSEGDEQMSKSRKYKNIFFNEVHFQISY